MSTRQQKQSHVFREDKNGGNDQEEQSDEEQEQLTSLMSQAAMSAELGRRKVATPVQLTGENSYLDQGAVNMELGEAPRPVIPTSKLAWVGFGLSVFALTCMCISFASPYWLQQWELSFNTFNNMGLWEACFHNYMHYRDDLQEIYNGCFWVYNADQRYNKLRDWLVPRKSISILLVLVI